MSVYDKENSPFKKKFDDFPKSLQTQWTKKIIDETFQTIPNKNGSDTSVIYCVNKIRSAWK